METSQPRSHQPLPPDEEILGLRERVAELEAENSSLRQVEQTLRRNAGLFKALLSSSHEGIILLTAHMTFLRVAHSLLGYNDEDLAGQSLLTVVHPDDCSAASAAFGRVVEGLTKVTECEVRVRDQRGTWHWLTLEMTDMLENEDVQAIVLNNRRIDRPLS